MHSTHSLICSMCTLYLCTYVFKKESLIITLFTSVIVFSILSALMTIAGTVILYNPEEEILSNLLSYYPRLAHLYIYDNSAVESTQIKEWATSKSNVSYYLSGENEGISIRLNQAAQKAKEAGYEWLLTMDQDSYFDQTELDKYFNYLSNATQKDKVAMYGIEFEHKATDAVATDSEGTPIDYVITSGSLVNLHLFDKVGGFDEALFIDEVDLEYCYRAISKGYEIRKFKDVFLQHSLGKVAQFRSLKSFKITPRTLHSPLRVYYMIRNYLYVAKLYPNQFEASAKERRGALLNRIKNNLLYGEERMKVLRYIFRAYIDYKSNKMGKKA